MTLDSVEIGLHVPSFPSIMLWSHSLPPLVICLFFQRMCKSTSSNHIRGTFFKFMLYLLREGYQIFLHTHNVAFSKMDLSKQRQLFHARILLSPIHLQILPHQDTGPWFVLTWRVGSGCSRGYCLYSDGSGSPSLHPLLLTPKTSFVCSKVPWSLAVEAVQQHKQTGKEPTEQICPLPRMTGQV